MCLVSVRVVGNGIWVVIARDLLARENPLGTDDLSESLQSVGHPLRIHTRGEGLGHVFIP